MTSLHQHVWSEPVETKVLLRPAAKGKLAQVADKYGPVNGYDILTQKKCLVPDCDAITTLGIERTKF